MLRRVVHPHRSTALSLLAVVATCALAGASALGATRGTGYGQIVWRGDFETGDLSQWTLAPQEKDPNRIVVVTAPRREGRYAVRVTVLSGDNNVYGSGTGERAQLALKQQTTDGYEGREQWWAWSTYFDPTFTPNGSGWNFFTTFHHTGTTGQGNAGWIATGSAIVFRVCNGIDPNRPRCRYWTIDFNRQNARWYDFVFHVKWSSAYAGGLVELWENGRKVVRLTQLRTLYPGQGVYLKLGYYRMAQDSTAVIYYDGMRRGTSYAAVVKDFPPGTWPVTPDARPKRR